MNKENKASPKQTPMMRQYERIKSKCCQGTILFFRLGDFYEMFFDDAKEASGILDIALTRRNNVPMCGVPFHAAEQYIAKLVRSGRKVAICDQVEDAAQASGIVERDITRIVTPGSVLEEQGLESNRHNFLVGLFHPPEEPYGMAFLDLSTGTFWMETCSDVQGVVDGFVRYAPSECVFPERQEKDLALEALKKQLRLTWSRYDDWIFEVETATELLKQHFDVTTLHCFGSSLPDEGLVAAGGVLHYVQHELRRTIHHVRRLQVKRAKDYMWLDEATIKHLELLTPRGVERPSHPTSLLDILDTTCTSMGARLLRGWLVRPLADLDRIRSRQDAVAYLCSDRKLLGELRDRFKEVRDLERLTARLSAGSGNARDVRALEGSLLCVPSLKDRLNACDDAKLQELGNTLRALPDLVSLIQRALNEELPVSLREGGIIKEGYHEELDELRTAATQGRSWLAEYQAGEQLRTGIKSLKVRYNKVFGYYIEVTKTHLKSVPENYARKQTLVNAERFITPELKEVEHRILGAQDRAVVLEYELFQEIRGKVLDEIEAVQQSADALAQLDCLAALADRALALHYVRPLVTDMGAVRISDGRHPIVEQIPSSNRFVPNHTLLDQLEHQIMLITGPNMAGKSTYIRQIALIVIMAQVGSFVPAASAEIGMVDSVYTRIGASDDLSRGRSTFMVEMQETANILHHATERSLIVLDEIGRGTSTFDGISIAWAVAEYLHNESEVKAKTLFATHYHELTELARTLPGVKNYNVLVRERNDQITFLHKIGAGAADKSYGIHVGRLAGLPLKVVDRAQEILTNLEEREREESGEPKLAKKRAKNRTNTNQLRLFHDDLGFVKQDKATSATTSRKHAKKEKKACARF